MKAFYVSNGVILFTEEILHRPMTCVGSVHFRDHKP